jgi:hypothetical protein
MKKIYLFLLIFSCAMQSIAQEIINQKGTKVTIDSSKWKLSGNDIFFKNSGNIGIGTNIPSAQLHTTSGVRFQGIGINTTDTKILTADAAGNITTRLLSSLPTNIDSTISNNGLTLTGKNIQLGGNLIQATTITNNANPLTIETGGTALNITGLTSGASTDSLVTVNTTTGKINRISISTLNKIDSTTSNNGLTLTGKNIQLGGNLIQATTITNNANPLTIATGGTALNITGLPGGATTDSVVVINNATGQLRKIINTQPSLVEIFDVAGTQTLNTTFNNLILSTTTIADAGYTTASGVVTVTNAGLYRITFRATVNVTNNVASGAEFRLTNGGVAIPGTLGYTFQQNSNRPQGTVTVVKILSLAANSTISIQGRRYSPAGNLTLTANGSSLLIEKIR